jgi:hypothetical protein
MKRPEKDLRPKNSIESASSRSIGCWSNQGIDSLRVTARNACVDDGKLASASGDRSCTATRSIDSTASGFLVGGTCGRPFIRSGFFALTYVLILLGSAQAQSVITIGETSVLSAGDNDNSNLLLAQSAALAQAATIQSLSFYVTAARGSLILGIYDATGPNGGPGVLKASTNSFTPVTGWNAAKVVTPISLAAGNYWLAYLPGSNSLGFTKTNASGNCAYYGYTFGSLPSKFSASPTSCTPTTWSFYATLTLPSGGDAAVNGACGPSNGANLTSAPTTNLCSAGTASTVSGSGPWNWMCAGSSGGTTASCSALLEIVGTCGSANGVAVSTAPRANLCSAGKASAVSGSGPWTWSCTGSNGGATGLCWAPTTSAVNGACGSSNGADLTSAPTSHLCSAGTASAVSGSGPWIWSCTGLAGGTTASCGALAAGGVRPVLIQHVASSANPVGLGIPGSNYKIPLPNPVLAGDALVLGITYPSGGTIKISDTLGQTWPAASIMEDGGTGNNVTSIYVLCGSAAGSETITVGTANSLPFEYTVSEFNKVAATRCVDGSVGGGDLSPNDSAVISPGSFTPATNNNANGGHIIWNYTAISGGANGNPTSWTPAADFTLLDGDIAWINDQGFPHASQWYVQTTNGSITPSITSTGDTVDSFNSASVSLLVAGASGTMPSGIHVNKIIHETWTALSSGETLSLQLPTTGNLRVLAFPAGLNNIDITSITDSDGSTWIPEQTGGDSAQIWYAADRPANPNLMVDIHTSGTSPTNSARFYDVQGAAASPFDVAAGTDLTPCSSVITINNQPTITPTGANELVIATMGIGDGPGLGLASGAPSGGVWDLTTYTGELDLDLMENADAQAHLYNTTTATENWNWTITSNGDNSCSAEAVAFKHD